MVRVTHPMDVLDVRRLGLSVSQRISKACDSLSFRGLSRLRSRLVQAS